MVRRYMLHNQMIWTAWVSSELLGDCAVVISLVWWYVWVLLTQNRGPRYKRQVDKFVLSVTSRRIIDLMIFISLSSYRYQKLKFTIIQCIWRKSFCHALYLDLQHRLLVYFQPQVTINMEVEHSLFSWTRYISLLAIEKWILKLPSSRCHDKQVWGWCCQRVSISLTCSSVQGTCCIHHSN